MEVRGNGLCLQESSSVAMVPFGANTWRIDLVYNANEYGLYCPGNQGAGRLLTGNRPNALTLSWSLIQQYSNSSGDDFEFWFYHFGSDGFEQRMKGPNVYRLPTPFSEVSTNFEGNTPVFTFHPFFFASEGRKMPAQFCFMKDWSIQL